MKRFLIVLPFIGSLLAASSYGATLTLRTLRPNEDYSTELDRSGSGLTANYQAVDEAFANDSDDFVYSTSTSLLRDNYHLEDPGSFGGAIAGIKVYSRGYDSYGTGIMTFGIITYDTSYFSENVILPDSWTTFSKTWTTNPKTGFPWTWNEIENIIIHVSLATEGTSANCTQLYIEVYCDLIQDSGDFDGDGTSDIAVFRPSLSLWAVKDLTRAYLGTNGDIPACGDYDGDGTSDITLFRPSSSLWTAWGITRFYFGSSADLTVPGDYDGDGICEAGVFRPSGGLWAIRGLTRVYFGSSGDTAIPGYFDPDDSKDMAIFRGSTGQWSVRNITKFYFGSSTDELVPGDYNGAGSWEGGIFQPSDGLWSIRNVTSIYFGNSTDLPVPADYNGDSVDDAAFFRGSAGLWAVSNLTRVYFGSTGDIPITR
jgi:hypothetical protein